MKIMGIILMSFFLVQVSFAAEFEGAISEWNKNNESFKKSEETFKKVLETLKTHYVDKGVTEEDLYRAATEGMLAALNNGKNNWNTLLSPRDMEDLQIEMTGKLAGIGATLEFDKNTGYARVRNVLAGSAALKAGIQVNDLILSVNGKHYKELKDMVADIRGKTGEKVRLKILRQESILDMNVTRSQVSIPFAESAMLNDHTGYLKIESFTNPTLKEVVEQMSLFKGKKLSKLIIDLRNNRGGLFEKSLEVADLFLKNGDVIVKTKSRDGSVRDYKAKATAWSPETRIVVLTDAETESGAEILTAALRENRGATIIGAKTVGKWTVESVESLPNGYAMKYSVMSFESPSGKSFQNTGLTPDIEIVSLTEPERLTLLSKDLKGRMAGDPVLRAAVELK